MTGGVGRAAATRGAVQGRRPDRMTHDLLQAFDSTSGAVLNNPGLLLLPHLLGKITYFIFLGTINRLAGRFEIISAECIKMLRVQPAMEAGISAHGGTGEEIAALSRFKLTHYLKPPSSKCEIICVAQTTGYLARLNDGGRPRRFQPQNRDS